MPRVKKCLIYIGVAAFLHQFPRFFEKEYVPHFTVWRGHREEVCRVSCLSILINYNITSTRSFETRFGHHKCAGTRFFLLRNYYKTMTSSKMSNKMSLISNNVKTNFVFCKKKLVMNTVVIRIGINIIFIITIN